MKPANNIPDMPKLCSYGLVSENPESTIVAEFEPGYRSSAQYQSEAEMEADFIRQLERQAYERVNITSEADLIANLRGQIERLNDIQFTDNEWKAFFAEHLGNPNHGIVEKTPPFRRITARLLSARTARRPTSPSLIKSTSTTTICKS